MLTVEIDTQGDAFSPAPGHELARLLRKLADKVQTGIHEYTEGPEDIVLNDMNGNVVLHAEYDDEGRAAAANLADRTDELLTMAHCVRMMHGGNACTVNVQPDEVGGAWYAVAGSPVANYTPNAEELEEGNDVRAVEDADTFQLGRAVTGRDLAHHIAESEAE